MLAVEDPPEDFDSPSGVTTDSSGNVYVSDNSNNRVQKFDSDGNYLTEWGSYGTGDGEFRSLRGLAVDSSGNVYVVDWNNVRVQKFDSDGNYLTQWGTTGDDPGEFMLASGIAIDSSGNVYVVEYTGNRVQKFDSDGNYLTQWGSYGTDDGEFNYPKGVAVDSSGNVYVADSGNNRVQKFDSDGNYLTQWEAYGSGVSEDDLLSILEEIQVEIDAIRSEIAAIKAKLEASAHVEVEVVQLKNGFFIHVTLEGMRKNYDTIDIWADKKLLDTSEYTLTMIIEGTYRLELIDAALAKRPKVQSLVVDVTIGPNTGSGISVIDR